jgi:hypothetical protein
MQTASLNFDCSQAITSFLLIAQSTMDADWQYLTVLGMDLTQISGEVKAILSSSLYTVNNSLCIKCLHLKVIKLSKNNFFLAFRFCTGAVGGDGPTLYALALLEFQHWFSELKPLFCMHLSM